MYYIHIVSKKYFLSFNIIGFKITGLCASTKYVFLFCLYACVSLEISTIATKIILRYQYEDLK